MSDAFSKAWGVLKGANTWGSRHSQESPRARIRARDDYQGGIKNLPKLQEMLQREIQRIEGERGNFRDRQQVRDFNLGNYGPTEQFPERESLSPEQINPKQIPYR